MSKWSGKIGFAEYSERLDGTRGTGIWEEVIIEHQYYGDFLKNYRTLNKDAQINNDVDISNQISFVADPYAYENFHKIRYAEFMGTKWRVASVEVQYPRLIASLGGLYNEQP